MAIQVTCLCSRKFNAPDHLAGKVVQCPTCQSEITIPGNEASNSMNDLLDSVGIATTTSGVGKCPKCFAPLEEGAIICVGCGTNLETGDSVIEKKKKRPGEGAAYTDVSLGDSRLDRALVELEKDRQREKKSHDPVAWWIYLAILDLLLSACITAAIMMMTYDDLKSSRMQMMNIDYNLVEDNLEDIYVIATETTGYSNPPPYTEDDEGSPLTPNTMGRRTDDSGSYIFLETRNKGSFWVADSALQFVEGDAIQAKIDAENAGSRPGDFKYGFRKGLGVGMWVMLVLSTGLILVALGHITVIGFQEEVGQGALCLTIGYALFYAITRAYKTKGPLKMFIFGIVLVIAATIMVLTLDPQLPLVRGMKDV